MKFIGMNRMRINRDTVEHAIIEWLNQGIYSKENVLIVRTFEHHVDGGMTLHFERRGPLSDRQQERIAQLTGVQPAAAEQR